LRVLLYTNGFFREMVTYMCDLRERLWKRIGNCTRDYREAKSKNSKDFVWNIIQF